MPLPSGIKKVIIPLSFLFFFGAAWFGLFEPQFKKSREYREKLRTLEQQIEAITRQVGSYEPPTPEESERWQRLAEEIERRIPEGRQLTELYAYLSDLAEKSKLQNFNRQLVEGSDQESEEDGIKRSSVDLELTFQGEYKSVMRFLAGLHSLERLVEVQKLDVSRRPPLVGVKIILRSYYSS
ncbi:MAG: type 4a pilus biogenesis protein PilO [Candidatus Glassbacteria bacterium]|nr:type 4a pilus biogenesis protein PilO [Candidatus Glassbacteria bacterium]